MSSESTGTALQRSKKIVMGWANKLGLLCIIVPTTMAFMGYIDSNKIVYRISWLFDDAGRSGEVDELFKRLKGGRAAGVRELFTASVRDTITDKLVAKMRAMIQSVAKGKRPPSYEFHPVADRPNTFTIFVDGTRLTTMSEQVDGTWQFESPF